MNRPNAHGSVYAHHPHEPHKSATAWPTLICIHMEWIWSAGQKSQYSEFCLIIKVPKQGFHSILSASDRPAEQLMQVPAWQENQSTHKTVCCCCLTAKSYCRPLIVLRSTFLPTHAAMRAQIIFGTRCQVQYALFYFNQGSISGFEIPGRPLWTQRGPQCWESCVTVWPLWDLCKSRDHVIAAISSILFAPSLRTQWACHSPNSWPNEVVRTKVCDAHLSIETAVILPETKSCWSGGSLRIMNP